MDFVKQRLLLEEECFPDGINEYIVIIRAWEIDTTEDLIKNAINYLINIGNIEVVKDEKGIRFVRWKKIHIDDISN